MCATPRPPTVRHVKATAWWRRRGDVLLAAGLLALTLFGVVAADEIHPKPALVALTIAQVAPLAWRRRAPLVIGVLSTGAYVALNAVCQGPYPPDLAVLPAAVAVY